jgi:hypothetical protein
MRKLITAAFALTLVSGCTIKHYVAQDYPQYLVNNEGQSQLPTTKAANYAIAERTRAHYYDFRSNAAGQGNLWIVQFGQMLDSTLQSRDVQAAFGRLVGSSAEDPDNGLLVFDLQSYWFSNMTAHVALQITHKRGGTDMFSTIYQSDGRAQGGKVFWGGGFAMKNTVHQSTKQALDDILRQLIADLNAQSRRGSAPSARR